MTKLLFLVLFASIAQAGVIKVATYPVRHPVKLVKKTGHAIWKVVY